MFRSFLFLRSKGGITIKRSQSPDWRIIDFEDGCSNKPEARRRVADELAKGYYKGFPTVVRVNSLNVLNDLKEDLKHCVHRDIYGIILSKTTSLEDLHAFEDLISQVEKEKRDSLLLPQGDMHRIKFIPNVESPSGILNSLSISKGSSRNFAIAFGHADFLSESRGCDDPRALSFAKAFTVHSARAAGIEAIDTPYLHIWDSDGLREECSASKTIGFSGKFAVHPIQVPTINQLFSPSKLEVKVAKEIIQQRIGLIDPRLPKGPYFIAVPHVKIATQTVIEATKAQEHNHNFQPLPTIKPQRVTTPYRYGLAPDAIRTGLTLHPPYEITVTDAMLNNWSTFFFEPDRITTSDVFAQRLGFESGTPAPYYLLLNLAMGMSVSSYSESCRYHLGILDAVNERPVYRGDTLSNEIIIEKVMNPSNKYRVVESRHVLYNQRKERVFSMLKRSLFDAHAMKTVPLDLKPAPPLEAHRLVERRILSSSTEQVPRVSNCRLEAGQLIAHGMVRPIGVSENLLFCNMMKNTHHLHYDYSHYGTDNILVSGGYILTSVAAATARDLGEIVHQELLCCAHVGKVRPMVPIGALSFIKHVKPIEGTDFEEVLVRTWGVKNIDVEKELMDEALPRCIFEDDAWDSKKELRRSSEINDLCEEHAPLLHNRLIMQLVRKLIRLRTK